MPVKKQLSSPIDNNAAMAEKMSVREHRDPENGVLDKYKERREMV